MGREDYCALVSLLLSWVAQQPDSQIDGAGEEGEEQEDGVHAVVLHQVQVPDRLHSMKQKFLIDEYSREKTAGTLWSVEQATD